MPFEEISISDCYTVQYIAKNMLYDTSIRKDSDPLSLVRSRSKIKYKTGFLAFCTLNRIGTCNLGIYNTKAVMIADHHY
jgi:hypothetical protein